MEKMDGTLKFSQSELHCILLKSMEPLTSDISIIQLHAALIENSKILFRYELFYRSSGCVPINCSSAESSEYAKKFFILGRKYTHKGDALAAISALVKEYYC